MRWTPIQYPAECSIGRFTEGEMGAWRNRPRSRTSTASPAFIAAAPPARTEITDGLAQKSSKKCAPSPQRLSSHPAHSQQCRSALSTLARSRLNYFPPPTPRIPADSQTRRKKNDWHFSRDLIGRSPFLARTALAVTRRNARRTSMEAGGLDDRGAPPRSTNSSSYEERPPFPCLQLSIRRRSQCVAGGSLRQRRRYCARFVGRRRSSAVPRLRV